MKTTWAMKKSSPTFCLPSSLETSTSVTKLPLKGAPPLLQDPDGRSHPSFPSTGWSGGVLTEGTGGYPAFGDGCINRHGRAGAVPPALQHGRVGGPPGTPRLSPPFAERPGGRSPAALLLQRIFLLLVVFRRSNPKAAANAVDPYSMPERTVQSKQLFPWMSFFFIYFVIIDSISLFCLFASPPLLAASGPPN